MNIEIKDAGGDRGLLKGTFTDRYGTECSIQTSSLATEPCIWLGQHQCEKCEAPTRMHLTQDMARDLIKLLRYFVRTGTLPEEDPYRDDQPTPTGSEDKP